MGNVFGLLCIHTLRRKMCPDPHEVPLGLPYPYLKKRGWRNGSGIEDVHAGGIAPPRPLMQRRLTRAQEARLLQETAELFVPTMRALYAVGSLPSEETWPEQALPYAIAFKPPADWPLDEQTRAIALPGAEPA